MEWNSMPNYQIALFPFKIYEPSMYTTTYPVFFNFLFSVYGFGDRYYLLQSLT